MAKRKTPAPKPVVGKAKALSGEAVGDKADAPAPDMTSASAAGLSPGAERSAPLRALFAVAEEYGQRSFDNYARIRSVAETLRDSFCEYLSDEPGCVFLVPPEGRFTAKNYQSAAFSVAGKGYLPLKPISFGLAVLVSEDRDFIRVKITCHKEGDVISARIEGGETVRIALDDGERRPDSEDLEPLYRAVYEHVVSFFQDRLDDFNDGRYGQTEIGFDLQRMTGG